MSTVLDSAELQNISIIIESSVGQHYIDLVEVIAKVKIIPGVPQKAKYRTTI